MTIHSSFVQFSSLREPPFDTAAYSRLKFGDDIVAERFGYEMAVDFYLHHPDFFEKPVVVIAAPSSATVPAASTLLAHHMMHRFNMIAIDYGLPLIGWTPIHRITTYYDNYAFLPAEERSRLLSQDRIFINREYIEGKSLIFVDDCNITGTHENKIEEFLVDSNITNDHAYACYAKYVGDDPSIEGRLNHVDIDDIRDLVDMMRDLRNRFIFTTRAVRLFLESRDVDFAAAIAAIGDYQRSQLYNAAIAKEYHAHPAFQTNFNILKAYCHIGH